MTIIGTYPPYQNPDLPPGIVVPYAGFAAPVGWLLCNGQAVSRALYSSLFAVIGGQYGGGDGVNTFNVPDLQGRAVYGIGDGTPGVNYHGANEGQPWVHLRGPHHGHSHTLNDPGHTHTYHYPQAVDWQYTNWLNAGPFLVCYIGNVRRVYGHFNFSWCSGLQHPECSVASGPLLHHQGLKSRGDTNAG